MSPVLTVLAASVTTVLATYGLLVLVWCAGGKWIGSHPLILKALDRWGHWIGPFVLIGLGDPQN
jgi:cadmium resistance protein CadD (predicted permease)